MKILPIRLLLGLLGLSSQIWAQEVLPPLQMPLTPPSAPIEIIQVLDARFQASPSFAGIVETGSDFVKKTASFHRPLAEILDSVAQSLPQTQSDRAPVIVKITRLGIREDIYDTRERAFLSAEFEFLQPQGDQLPVLLDRQSVNLSYEGRKIINQHSAKVAETFFTACDSFFSQNPNPQIPATPAANILTQQAIQLLREKNMKEGIYSSYESFLHNKPDQPLESQSNGNRELVLFTLEGKKRPVKNTDPIWGAYYQGQLYVYDWGLFFPAYLQNEKLIFSGINTKSQTIATGTASGVLSTEGTGSPEHRRPYILDWQTGGYYEDPAFIKTKIISIKGEAIEIPDRKFNITEVIDARFQADSAFIGIGQKGAHNTNVPLSLEKSLATSVREYLHEQLPAEEGYLPVILRIKRLGVWEQTFTTAELAYIDAELEFLTKVNDKYVRLHTEKVFQKTGGLDVTSSHSRQIGSALAQAIRNYAQSVEGPGNISEENIVSSIYTPDIPPIVRTNDRKPGIYATFEEFRNNAPSQPAEFIYKPQERQLLFTTSKGKTRPVRPNDPIWGVYHGNQLYIHQLGVFFPVNFEGSALEFEGYDVGSHNSKAATAGIAFGLIGAAIAQASSAKTRSFVIDWQTGSFYPKL
ncbi:MAG: hypothetical protein SF052_01190 [Bacteroidia bacterium]|nr:hypothetical protein [Bacteroidia bacterium]